MELVDADLLDSLRGLGKPPTFDGNDADSQDLRFSFSNPREPRQFCLTNADG